jgi:hypothetical protein
MLVILVTVHSQGLKTSADIVAQTIRKGLADKAEVATIIVPEYLTFQTADANDQELLIHKRVDVVIFLERLLAHTQLWAARHRILIPNPEKTAEHAVASIPGLTEIWHKTHASLTALAARFPNLHHSYIGFTSPDFFGNGPDFERFVHLSGSSGEKQSEIVLTAWQKHPEWPELSVQSYINHKAFLQFPEWLQWRNMRFKYCRVTAEDYRLEATRAGVHLCPSAVEGFGHYLNEARSMGALIVTTDGPPMNELLDETCAVMVSPVRTEKQNFGVRNIIDVVGFEKAILQVLQLPIERRKSMGAAARRRYVHDRARFESQLVGELRRLAES